MSNNNQTIEIPFSKTKIVLLTFGCSAFVFTSLWLWSIANTQTHYAPIRLQIISVLGISFFGLGGIVSLIKLFDKRPGLIIDNEGLHDNSGVSKGRLIPWKHITHFDIAQIKQTRLLLIFVDNVDEVINRESMWKQKIMKLTNNMYGTPVSISSGTLKCDFDALVKMVTEKHQSIGAGIKSK